MRRVAIATFFLVVCPLAIAQHHHAAAAPGRESPCEKLEHFAPAVLQPALQKVDWQITGTSADAKLFFSQGMTQYYGFNYEEAMRNFRKAKQLDAQMAMASWGLALAAGPNINLGMDKPCHELANRESARAISLAKNVTPVESALIDALPLRYAYPLDKPKDTEVMAAVQRYSGALGAKWNASSPDAYRGNANFGALYAESLIELHPWALYKDGLPTTPDTDKILSVLKTAMEVEPQAVGANHFWIHTVEASTMPGCALKSANLLQTLVEASGHLVHMPSHIYLLLGDYKKAVDGNIQASAVDFGQYGAYCSGTYPDYTGNDKCPQLYYGHYLSHNYFFGSVSATFSGQSQTAVKMACDTRAHAERFVANEPGLQRYMTAALMTLVVNRNWKAILAEKEAIPPATCYSAPFPTSGCHIARAIWYWARGMATVGDGGDPRVALARSKDMDAEMKAIAGTDPETWGNNSAVAVLNIGKSILKAHYMWEENENEAIADLEDAVRDEEKLNYDEPPQWFTPARESLGGAYLRVEKYEMAEKVFDDELAHHPESGRALYGKMRALKGKGALATAEKVRAQFCDAWRFADYTMTDSDLWPASVHRDGGKDVVTCEEREKKVSKPSEISCPARPWPPPPSQN